MDLVNTTLLKFCKNDHIRKVQAHLLTHYNPIPLYYLSLPIITFRATLGHAHALKRSHARTYTYAHTHSHRALVRRWVVRSSSTRSRSTTTRT
jgi:hypothetical protein